MACCRPRRSEVNRAEIDDYYSEVLSRAEAALSSGEDWFDPDGCTTVQVGELGTRSDAQSVEIWTWLADSPNVEDHVSAALHPPLVGKLGGQLSAAHRAGYRVMLLIDQVQDLGRRQPMMFLSSWGTVKGVVDRIVSSSPGVIDSVWFRASDGSFRSLTVEATD